MPKVKVAGFSFSLDGFAAGTDQSPDHPLGVRGDEIFQWFFPTRTFRQMLGKEDGETGPDGSFSRSPHHGRHPPDGRSWRARRWFGERRHAHVDAYGAP